MLTLVKIINTLNNAVLLKKYKVVIKHFNTFSLNVLKLLQQLNIIDSYLVNDTFTTCIIFLNTATNNVFFQKILCISKPHKFIYCTVADLIKLRSIDLYNDYILSINDTNHTIINIDTAIRQNKGGLLLLKVIK